MCYFHPPKRSTLALPIVVSSIILHSISFYSFKAIVLILLATKFHLKEDELKYVTFLFDLVQYAFLVLGAVLQEIISDKLTSIILLVITSVIVQFVFYISGVVVLVKITILTIAAISSTLKIGFIAYGAAEYYTSNSAALYVYFLGTYIAEMFGHFVALCIVPLSMMLAKDCGNVDCLTYVMCVSIIFEIISGFVFSSCTSTSEKISGYAILKDVSKLNRLLTLFIPLLVIWICQEGAMRQLTPLAKLMDCRLFWYYFNAENMLLMDLIIIIFCGSIYYFALLFKGTVTKPIFTIGFGGLLMALGLILSSYLHRSALKDPIVQKPGVNYSLLYIASECENNIIFSVMSFNITFGDKYILRNGYVNINGATSCGTAKVGYVGTGYHAVQPLNKTVCFNENKVYAIIVKCLYNSRSPNFFTFSMYNFDIRRDLSGQPKLCILTADGSWKVNYHIKLQPLNLLGARYTFMSNDNFTCRVINEGSYNIIIDYEIKEKNILLEHGGVYLIINDLETHQVIGIQKPLDKSIWYLIAALTLIEFGKILILVPGFFVIYSQTQVNIRTIAIGAWCLYISSGIFLSSISDGLKGYAHMDTLVFTGILVGLMTVIFLVIFKSCGQWLSTCNEQPIHTEIEMEASILSVQMSESSSEHDMRQRKPVLTVTLYKDLKAGTD